MIQALRTAFKRLKYESRVWTGRISERPSPTAAFGVRAGYRHRIANEHFDDTANKDEWQREVYQEAAKIAAAISAATVVDVGCGSGYKLVEFLGSLDTIGLELEPALGFLRRTYPGRDWRDASSGHQIESADLVVCADVIEHMPDPDTLMDFLAGIRAKKWVISTPDRRLMYGWDHSGPPRNPAHCREWTSREFPAYVGRWLHVERACISNRRQATQMVICGPRV